MNFYFQRRVGSMGAMSFMLLPLKCLVSTKGCHSERIHYGDQNYLTQLKEGSSTVAQLRFGSYYGKLLFFSVSPIPVVNKEGRMV